MKLLQERLGIALPVIQAPMAGVQGSALTVAVCKAGGLGSLPGAMLGSDALRKELAAIQSQTSGPYNVNFFCHVPPKPDPQIEAAWRKILEPYYREFGIDEASIPNVPGRAPFSHEAADALSEFKPPVVSFHFGLPVPDLLARVQAWMPLILSSATTVEEARWLEARGVDAIIAQGLEAGGHRGHFLSTDTSVQMGTLALIWSEKFVYVSAGTIPSFTIIKYTQKHAGGIRCSTHVKIRKSRRTGFILCRELVAHKPF